MLDYPIKKTRVLFQDGGMILLLRHMTRLFICLLSLLAFASSSASVFPKKYDHYFKSASIFLPPGTPWQLLKAQCWQESRLKPKAVSPVGAVGLCQFMPPTWKDMKKKYMDLKTPWNPESSIRAAALYMNALNKIWKEKRSKIDRYKLALASYNSGVGNVLKAQELSGGAKGYKKIISYLYKVTGSHSKETIEYVDNIFYKWLPQMLAR